MSTGASNSKSLSLMGRTDMTQITGYASPQFSGGLPLQQRIVERCGFSRLDGVNGAGFTESRREQVSKLSASKMAISQYRRAVVN
jgi:hypothetical protein